LLRELCGITGWILLNRKSYRFCSGRQPAIANAARPQADNVYGFSVWIIKRAVKGSVNLQISGLAMVVPVVILNLSMQDFANHQKLRVDIERRKKLCINGTLLLSVCLGNFSLNGSIIEWLILLQATLVVSLKGLEHWFETRKKKLDLW
jgi:hypothetical protein